MNRIVVVQPNGRPVLFDSNVEQVAQRVAEAHPETIYFFANVSMRFSEPVKRDRTFSHYDLIYKIIPLKDCTAIIFNNGVEACSHGDVYISGEPSEDVDAVPNLRPMEFDF